MLVQLGGIMLVQLLRWNHMLLLVVLKQKVAPKMEILLKVS